MNLVGCTDLRVRAGSKRWHALRNAGIGASEIAAVIGVSPYLSATTLYYRKRGDLPEQGDNARMEWGRRLERTILGRFRESHPELTHALTGRLYRSDRLTWQLATPDCVTWLGSGPVVVEIKTGASKDDWGENGSDDIPVHYRCQVLQAMDVTGARVAYLPVLFNGREYREYRVEWDEDDARILRAKGSEFWRRVEQGDPPPPDAHKSTGMTLRGLWDVEPSKEILIPLDLAQKYCRALAVQDRIDAVVDRYDNEIRSLMGDARKAWSNGQVVATRSAWEQNAFDSARFREDHPDLWATYQQKSPRQRFNWKGLS